MSTLRYGTAENKVPWNTVEFSRVLWYIPQYNTEKTFLCSTQLSTKFIMLINIKMPIIVDILTFVSMINTTSESLKPRKVFIFQH